MCDDLDLAATCTIEEDTSGETRRQPLNHQPEPDELKELFGIRNSLLECRTLECLLERSANLARRRVKAQIASIFLFSKDGLLQRKVIDGRDKEGNPIPSTWYSHETYKPGEIFTGTVVSPPQGSNFGEPQWTANLAAERLGEESRSSYLSCLGALECAAAVPLNGRHRTYGVLEVINKVDDADRRVPLGTFMQPEVYWLSLIGVTTAAAITILRSQDQLSLLANVSQTTTRPFLENDDPQSTYDAIARDMTGPLTSYKACIIRVGRSKENLEILAKAGDGISWDNRAENDVLGESIYSKVFETARREVVEDVNANLHRFAHDRWIIENRLQSHGCFPLTLKQRVIGTLSLYTGFRHVFDESEIAFLENIAFLLASLGEAFHSAGRLTLDDISVADEQGKILSGARAVSHDRIVTELRHSHKRYLIKLRRSLEGIAANVGGRAGRILDQQIKDISMEVDSILDQFASVAHSDVSLNHMAQAVLKSYARELNTKGIKYELVLASDVPNIEASEVEIRDMIVNLITNAIRAIEKARQRRGLIALRTRVSSVNKKETLELSVEDNGVGIRNEDLEDITSVR
jgi:signal transduction histidine kinase